MRLCTYFKFNGDVHEQTKGKPLGPPISEFFPEASTEALENIALPRTQPKLWVRFADDAFIIIKYWKNENNQQCVRMHQLHSGIGERGRSGFSRRVGQKERQNHAESNSVSKQTHKEQILNRHCNHPNNQEKVMHPKPIQEGQNPLQQRRTYKTRRNLFLQDVRE